MTDTTRPSDTDAQDETDSTAAEATAEALAEQLSEVFEHQSGEFYGMNAEPISSKVAMNRMRNCQLKLSKPLRERLWGVLPLTTRLHPHLTVTHRELAGLIKPTAGLDTQTGATHRETETIVAKYRDPPPLDELTPYRDGPPIGIPKQRPLADRSPSPIGYPAKLRDTHTAIIGQSGTGKSILAEQLAVNAWQMEDGPVYVFDPKGGIAEAVSQMAYAQQESIEDVEIIDFASTVPRLPQLSIRQLQKADPEEKRQTLVDNVVQDALNGIVLAAKTGDDGVPPKSLELLELVFRLCFGTTDAVSFEAILRHIRAYIEGEELPEPPAGIDDEFIEALTESGTKKLKSAIGGGALRLLQRFFVSEALRGPIGTPPTAQDDDEVYDLTGSLTSNTLYVFDFSALNSAQTSLISQLVIARLWRLAKATDETPLADLIIDEAYELAAPDLLHEIIGQGRGFGIGLTLLSQSLNKFDDELAGAINTQIETVIAGRAENDIARLFAEVTAETDSAARVLEHLKESEWLCRLRSPRHADPPDAFVLNELDLPRGHPDAKAQPFSLEEYRTARTDAQAHQRSRPDLYTRSTRTKDTTPKGRITTGLETTLATASLPGGVTYERESDSETIACASCQRAQTPTHDGVRKAYACCRQADVDEIEIQLPVVDIKLHDVSERAVKSSNLTIEEIQFLRLLELSHHGTIPPAAFDLRYDSMTVLRNEVGLDSHDVTGLTGDDDNAGLVRKHDAFRGNYYSLTQEGWETLALLRGEAVAETTKRLPGTRHVSESIIHIRLKELAAAWVKREYKDDPDSPVTTVELEHTTDDHRLDVAGLTEGGDVHIAMEAERDTDIHGGAPRDYDVMAACDPAEALWVVRSREVTHRLMQALADPRDDVPRIDPPLPAGKDSLDAVSNETDLETSALSAPGCTDVLTVSDLR